MTEHNTTTEEIRQTRKPASSQKKKKRKVRYGALAVLAAGVLLIDVLLIWGISSLFSHQESRNYQKQASEIIETEKSRLSQIESIEKPKAISQETFDALRAQAADESAISAIDAAAVTTEDELAALQGDLQKSSASQAAYLLEHINDYTEDILAFYLRDFDRYEFVKAWPVRDQYQSPVETLEEGVESVPALLQWDLRWGYQPYGDDMIYSVGCAPTTFSMVASYLNQDPSMTPRAAADQAMELGAYESGQGTLYSYFDQAAQANGLVSEMIETTPESVQAALDEGKVLIFHLLPGQFTTFGHFVVVPSMENGQLKINDPNSIERSDRLWDPQEVLSETAAIWAFSKP